MSAPNSDNRVAKWLACGLLAIHAILAICIIVRVRVPGLFASPGVFALVTAALVLPALYWVPSVHERPWPKVLLFGYSLAALLVFPKAFAIQPEI